MERYLWIGGLLLCVLGVGLTGYLSWAHYNGAIGAVCGEASDCATVLRSGWATFLGLPTALYGLLYYGVSALLLLGYPLVHENNRGFVMNLMLGLHGFAVGVSILLTGYAVGTLDAACPYCITSLALSVLLFSGVAFWKIRGSRLGIFAGGTDTVWQSLAVASILLAIVVGGLYAYGVGGVAANSSEDTIEKHILAYDAVAVGRPGAPVRVVEFFDLACPFCQRFTLDVFPRIKEEYIDTGRVLWTFRHSSLRGHDHSAFAHAALLLVPDDQFLDAKKQIMREEARWTAATTRSPRPYFDGFLSQYGLGADRVTDARLEYIRQRRRVFARMGVTGTPFFLVNGRGFRAGTFQGWKRHLDRLLEQAAPARR